MHSEGYSSWVCVSVCLFVCVCLLGNISHMERLIILKTLLRTQRSMKVKIFVGICLKRLRSRVMLRNMSEKANMQIIPTYPVVSFLHLTHSEASESTQRLSTTFDLDQNGQSTTEDSLLTTSRRDSS